MFLFDIFTLLLFDLDLDQVALGPSLLIHNQSIGVATRYDGFGKSSVIILCMNCAEFFNQATSTAY